jgi:hypothetical protein
MMHIASFNYNSDERRFEMISIDSMILNTVSKKKQLLNWILSEVPLS